jgi:hypothetical protein
MDALKDPLEISSVGASAKATVFEGFGHTLDNPVSGRVRMQIPYLYVDVDGGKTDPLTFTSTRGHKSIWSVFSIETATGLEILAVFLTTWKSPTLFGRPQ